MIKTKVIVITGGVFSSLGKGIIAASIGRILKEKNYKVAALKLDPYLNLDPGTMSPYQHGEVFVTYDGGETDLDLGHYERFLDYEVSKISSVSAGKIYDAVLTKERNGDYMGKTVQVVPHITNEIRDTILKVIDQSKVDFLIVEVGGTIGDIESLPFIESLRQFKNYYGKNNLLFLHVSPIFNLATVNELKTKPTQHSITNLRELGIIPDILILRSSQEISDEIKEKIAINSNLKIDEIFSCVDVNNIYLIPELLHKQNIHKRIFECLNVNDKQKNDTLNNWSKFTNKIIKPKKEKVNLAIVGKYAALSDAYISINESFKIASYENEIDLKIELINSEEINNQTDLKKLFKDFDAICVPYGFGVRGVEGKILTIQYCRENNIPFLGICLGMQLACIEFARNVLKLKDANSTEFDLNTTNPIFTIQKGKDFDKNLGGTLHLGNEKLTIKKNTLAYKLYNKNEVLERHRHRYEFNDQYLDLFEKNGMIFSVYNNESQMKEVVEIPSHKFFIATQYHPEFKSKPLNTNPLFSGLLIAAKKLIN